MNIRRAVAVALLTSITPLHPIRAQDQSVEALDAYFRAVAEFFAIPASEVAILGEWRLPPDEIPVALFIAHEVGVSPEALVALRRSGKGWSELTARYHLEAARFYVPLPSGASAGRLEAVYDRYRTVPTPSWSEVTLTDHDIVALVNLRLLSQTLHMEPERVLASAAPGTWVQIYARLLRESDTRQVERSNR